jgi:hypothetical protein
MVVVAHERPGVNSPSGAPAGLPKRRKEQPPILIVVIDQLPPVPPCHDVVNGTGILDANLPGHGPIVHNYWNLAT